ncbi:MAG: hypothetical protein BJ554DRAFT_6720, partial [Olpidium bornovanus]
CRPFSSVGGPFGLRPNGAVPALFLAFPQEVDQKKEDFRKYLEKNGIIDALTKVLVGLYEEPEKPESPVDYIKQFLGGPSEVDVEALRNENAELKFKVAEVEDQLAQLKAQVCSRCEIWLRAARLSLFT